MLVLTRKHGERLLIGDDIIITVLRINRYSIRIGIEAPKGVIVLREEIAYKTGPQRFDPDAGSGPIHPEACG